ncbi:MAG: hypothetical protein ACR2PK_13350 [Acidimicrobiales bacterium]
MDSNDTNSLTVDCSTCVMRETSACDDCVVSFICDRDPGDAVVITIDELRAMRTLSAGGLVPDLRHSTDPGAASRAAN